MHLSFTGGMLKPCAHACCVLRVMLRVECSCVLLRASRRSVTTLNCYMQRRSVAVLDASRSVAAAAGCGATRQSLGSLSRGRASYTAPEPFSEHAHEQVVSRSGGAILMVESGVRCEVTAIACTSACSGRAELARARRALHSLALHASPFTSTMRRPRSDDAPSGTTRLEHVLALLETRR